MNKIVDKFNSQEKTFSFELFPPKTEKGYTNLLNTINELCKLQPDYISCTYGAGGGSRDKTFDIVEHIEKQHQVTAMAHLTCVLNTRDDLKKIIDDIYSRDIRNILALRGDPPVDNPDWQPSDENFKYSSELISFIRKQYGKEMGVAVAGFPEGHLLAENRDSDADYLKLKMDAGADFIITQLFFDNQDYYDYVNRLKERSIKARVLPGVLPITNYQGLLKFTSLCGATVTDEVKAIFEPIQGDPEKVLAAGIDFAIKQCKDLLEHGAPGIHFYTLNKLSPTKEILDSIR